MSGWAAGRAFSTFRGGSQRPTQPFPSSSFSPAVLKIKERAAAAALGMAYAARRAALIRVLVLAARGSLSRGFPWLNAERTVVAWHVPAEGKKQERRCPK